MIVAAERQKFRLGHNWDIPCSSLQAQLLGLHPHRIRRNRLALMIPYHAIFNRRQAA
jgi:hypothetical protein